jgi:hypothetical protein
MANVKLLYAIYSFQTPNRSVSPIEPIKGSMSPKPRMKVSMETDGHENKEEPEDKECVVEATTAAGEAPDNADIDSEYFIKPVRRGIALAQEIHDQYLICKICLENFKDPKCLDCMHTFCEECIENHVASESSYKKYSDYRTSAVIFLVLSSARFRSSVLHQMHNGTYRVTFLCLMLLRIYLWNEDFVSLI